MKLTLNKKKLKNLSKDAQILPNDMTPNVGGGTITIGGFTRLQCISIGCGTTDDSFGSCGCDSGKWCGSNMCN